MDRIWKDLMIAPSIVPRHVYEILDYIDEGNRPTRYDLSYIPAQSSTSDVPTMPIERKPTIKIKGEKL